jgi:hypothetical protein
MQLIFRAAGFELVIVVHEIPRLVVLIPELESKIKEISHW